MSHVMDWDVHRTCQHANMCILVVFHGVCKKCTFRGGVKMVVFGGYPKKGHFGPPRGARNFLHPPPGKPRQNIYYLDTRHPPGGVRRGVVFRPPPGPSGRVCVLVPFLHPPAGVQKLGSWHHGCHDQPMEHTWCVKSFHVRTWWVFIIVTWKYFLCAEKIICTLISSSLATIRWVCKLFFHSHEKYNFENRTPIAETKVLSFVVAVRLFCKNVDHRWSLGITKKHGMSKTHTMWYFHDFVENAIFDMMRQNRRIGLKRKTRTPSFGGDPWRLESEFLRSGSAMEPPPPGGVPSRGGASDGFRTRSHMYVHGGRCDQG